MALEVGPTENQPESTKENSILIDNVPKAEQPGRKAEQLKELKLPPNATGIRFDIRMGSHYVVALARASTKGTVVNGWLEDIVGGEWISPEERLKQLRAQTTSTKPVCKQLNKLSVKKGKPLKRLE